MFVVVVFAVVCAGCEFKTVEVANEGDFYNALQSVTAGTNIVLSRNATYKLNDKQYSITASGEKDCPIKISCKSPGYATISGDLDLATSSYVEISNVTIVGGKLKPSGSNIVIDSVVFTSSILYPQGASYLTVRNCFFENVEVAIFMTKTTNSLLDHCTFGNYIDSFNIMMDSASSDNVITNCAFYGKRARGAQPSAWISLSRNSNNNVVQNSFFECSNTNMLNGIFVNGSFDFVFKDNFVVIDDGGIAFRVDNYRGSVCKSNRVFGGGKFTNARSVDESC